MRNRLIDNSLVRQQQFILRVLQLRRSELWERDKIYENKDEIVIITTASGKACTLDTCIILRSGAEVQGSYNLLQSS